MDLKAAFRVPNIDPRGQMVAKVTQQTNLISSTGRNGISRVAGDGETGARAAMARKIRQTPTLGNGPRVIWEL